MISKATPTGSSGSSPAAPRLVPPTPTPPPPSPGAASSSTLGPCPTPRSRSTRSGTSGCGRCAINPPLLPSSAKTSAARSVSSCSPPRPTRAGRPSLESQTVPSTRCQVALRTRQRHRLDRPDSDEGSNGKSRQGRMTLGPTPKLAGRARVGSPLPGNPADTSHGAWPCVSTRVARLCEGI